MLILTCIELIAQTSQVATLSHNGIVSTFYSANGLKDAYAQAVDGDIITLSAGTFTPVDIAKAITVRGAGMQIEDNPTIISGNFSISNNTEGDDSDHLTLEGLYVHGTLTNKTISNPSFIKIRVKELSFGYSNGSVTNEVFANCIIDDLSLDGGSGKTITSSFTGCVIKNLYAASATATVYTNCIIKLSCSPMNSSFRNCIITCVSQSRYLQSSCVASYCYSQGSSNIFKYVPSATSNYVLLDDIQIFKDEDSYELIDELAETWKGSDDTQAGIYGGSLPFDPYPSTPRITKFKVAPKTTADGKLSVEIEIKSNN